MIAGSDKIAGMLLVLLIAVETVLSLGVELVVLILDSYYLSYVGLYLAY